MAGSQRTRFAVFGEMHSALWRNCKVLSAWVVWSQVLIVPHLTKSPGGAGNHILAKSGTKESCATVLKRTRMGYVKRLEFSGQYLGRINGTGVKGVSSLIKLCVSLEVHGRLDGLCNLAYIVLEVVLRSTYHAWGSLVGNRDLRSSCTPHKGV